MALNWAEGIVYIEEEIINEEKVIKSLNKMGNKKAVGADGIKSKFYKVRVRSSETATSYILYAPNLTF